VLQQPPRLAQRHPWAHPRCAGSGRIWLECHVRRLQVRDRSLAPDGLRSITLKPGDAGKAKISVNGKGDQLPFGDSGSPLPLPLLVQLQNAQSGCWEARFESATTNDGSVFKASGD
jgi:hypothetical protein